MTDGNGNGNAGSETARALSLDRIFIKDMSFENPNAPEIFQGTEKEPETRLNLSNRHRSLGDDVYEVSLTISAHTVSGEVTVFMAEVQQAGQFRISGYGEEETQTLLGAWCPNALFPYAREALSSAVTRGGFPPLLINPINFEALYAQSQREKANSVSGEPTKQ